MDSNEMSKQKEASALPMKGAEIYEYRQGGDDITAHPNPANGGDIVCEAPLYWVGSMAHWPARARRIVMANNYHERLKEALQGIVKVSEPELLSLPMSVIATINTARTLLAELDELERAQS